MSGKGESASEAHRAIPRAICVDSVPCQRRDSPQLRRWRARRQLQRHFLRLAEGVGHRKPPLGVGVDDEHLLSIPHIIIYQVRYFEYIEEILTYKNDSTYKSITYTFLYICIVQGEVRASPRVF